MFTNNNQWQSIICSSNVNMANNRRLLKPILIRNRPSSNITHTSICQEILEHNPNTLKSSSHNNYVRLYLNTPLFIWNHKVGGG